MNMRETVQDFRQNPHIHDQSLAEQKDTVLHANTLESVACLEVYFLIHSKPVFPSFCCIFLFSAVVNQAAEFGHFLS